MGPRGLNGKFWGVTVLNLVLVGSVFVLVLLPAGSDSFANRVLACVMAALTGVTQIMMAYVAWKDPGFINPAKHQNEQTPTSY